MIKILASYAMIMILWCLLSEQWNLYKNIETVKRILQIVIMSTNCCSFDLSNKGTCLFKNPISPKDVQCRQVLLYLDGYCKYMNEGKWKWAVMYMWVRCVDFAFFCNFSIWFWNCSDYFVFILLLENKSYQKMWK